MFPVFYEISEKYKLGLEFKESDLSIALPGNSRVQLFGADTKGFIDRIRGVKTPMGGVDEGQSFRSHLEQLIDDVLTPCTADFRDGQVCLTGTPGPVPKGYFYECSQGQHGFKFHNWGVYSNPYFPGATEFVEGLRLRKGWDHSNPTYRREWQGEWVADTDALVYKYSEDRNSFDTIDERRDPFHYVLGVDLGYSPDPSAFVLCAYSSYDRNLYVLSAESELEMSVSDVAERIKSYQARYPALKVVADLGAQGKMIGADINRRYGIPLIPAEKHGKESFIEIMNSDLLSGVIKVNEAKCRTLIDEWMTLIWDVEKETQRVEDSRYPNHCADGALYAWRYCYNYAIQNRPEVVKRGSEREVDLYWEQKETEARLNRQRDSSDL